MSYADLTEAKEAVSGHIRSVLEITLTDKAGNRPTGDWWTESKTLHLCGGEQFLRTDTLSTAGFLYYEPLVKDWGEIVQECQIGQAFGNIADTQIVLHNQKIAAQQNNSTYSFSAGSPAMDPEPDLVQLSELFHFYNFLSATVVIKVLFFSGADTDQGTAANFTSRTIFNGFIQDVDITADDVTLDITQDETIQSTILPGRLLEDSIDKQVQTTRAPQAYGNFREHFTSTGSADEVNGLDIYNVIRAGLFRCTMANALPWKRDPDHDTGADNRLMYFYNDVKGRNVGWIGQYGYNGRESLNDGPYIYHAQHDVWTLLDSSHGSPTSGMVDWPTYPNDYMEEALINQEDYLRGTASIPCDSVYDEGDISSGSATKLINPENLFDGDPYTYAELPLDNDNYVDLRIREVSPLGAVVNEADAMVAYIVVDASTVTGSPDPSVRFGIFRPNNETNITYRKWLGQSDDGTDYGSDDTTYGDLDSSSGTFAKGFYDQGALNDTDVPASHYTGTNAPDLSRWAWRIRAAPSDTGTGETLDANAVVRIEVENQGGAGETLKIIAAGINVEHFPSQTQLPPTAPGRAVGRRGGGVYSRLRGLREVVESNIWISRATNTTDDTSGTLTGTNNLNLTYPCDIAAHLMLKWGDGVAAADVELDESAVSNGIPFGSGFRADEQMYGWDLSATGQHCQLVVNQETTLRAELDRFMSQFPLMIYREVGDDTMYFGFYPEDSTDVNRYYSGSTAITFHPNVDHPDADNYGSPYVVQDVKVKLTPLAEIFNRFTIRYRGYGPHGLTQKYTVTETPNDSNVLNPSTGINDDRPRDEPGGFNPSAVCRVSQERYGVSRWLNVEAPSLHTHYMSYALMHYFLKRFTQPRVLVEATCGPEAIDLKPGHLISFSNDMNLAGPIPDYGSAAAKTKGWAYTGETGDPHKDFIVQRIKRKPQDYGCETTFTSEQIMYNPRGAFWTPSDISTGTITEHLEADTYSGSDGDAVATWVKTVGVDAVQATAADKPTYQSDADSLQNGYGIMRWADNTDAFDLTGFTPPSANYVMVAVMNQNATANTQTLYRSQSGSLVIQIANSGNIKITHGGATDTIGAAVAGKQILAFVLDTAGSEVFRNGTSVGTGTYAGGSPSGTQHLGNRHTTGQGIDADLYEFMILTYPGTVDADEVTKLEGYMAHKWGLEANLPANHAYRYSPPTTG